MPTKSKPTAKPLKGLKFTLGAAGRLKEIAWTSRSSRIVGSDGQVIQEITKIEAPSAWSQQAVNIVARQYLRKSLPGGGAELSIRDLVDRVVGTIADFAENKRDLFANSDSAKFFRDELALLVLEQRASFNSPVWFNCGLWQRYGVRGAGGNWAVPAKELHEGSKVQAVPVANNYERPQCSACFIQSVDDDMNSIFELVKSEARIFKYGSGSGTNFSSLRGRQEALSGGGKSSGLLSFLEVFDRAAGATKSGGTTRRAAKMVCLNMDHPEINDFIRWKAKEEAKAQALIKAGFLGGLDGEAYRSVSGQNSNNSVRVTDAFMQAVKDDREWKTTARTGGAVVETWKARQLFRAIAESAWVCADPGVQYESAIQRWHTCAATAPIRASNPCSEFMFLDDTACNLASINLLKYLDDSGSFQIESFCQAVRHLIVAQETLVDLASYPTKLIAERSHRFRPLGLGYTNLGATLMALGVPYDSEQARQWAASVTALMTAEAYAVSVELAENFGAFADFNLNRESVFRVIENHGLAAKELRDHVAQRGGAATVAIVDVAEARFEHVKEKMRKHGVRNAQVTVLAPTGTIAFMMDCDTTGIEPEYALVKSKILAGGGEMTMVNKTVGRALAKLGYSSEERSRIVDEMKSNGGLGRSKIKTEHLSVFHCAGEIRPEAHLLMMAAVQPFLSGAISKTVNLSATATVEDVEAIFMRGWTLGLKAVTVYRDTSKSSQPLKGPSTASPVSGDKQNASVNALNRCPICSYPTVVTGTCWVCPQCGHSLACS